MGNNQFQSEKEQLSKIDWENIKSKVSVLEDSLSESRGLSSEKKRDILHTRAQTLSEEIIDTAAQQEFMELIAFRLGAETYAFETEFVNEVHLLNNYTPLPGLPDFVLGIINIRGQIYSIIDLKKMFNLPAIGIGELNKIIILQDENMEFGILADIILGTLLIPKDTIQTSYSSMPGIGAEYLKGITNEHLIILDAKKILNDPKILINQKTE